MGQSQGYEERQPHAHVGVFGSRAVSLGRRGNGGGGSPAWKPVQRATFGDYLSAECERLRGGDSLSSEAMAVEDSGPAKAEEQDRLKALGASIANLEKARGGKPDVAIDEVLRQKRLERQELKDQMQSRKATKALLKAAIAAREKAAAVAEGRDGSDANAVAETAGDFECEERSRREGARGRNAAGEEFGRGRLRRVPFSCLIFCILFCANVTSAVGA